MLVWIPTLAAVAGPELPPLDNLGNLPRASLGGTAWVLIAVLVIAFFCIIWAVFLRRPAAHRGRRLILTEAPEGGERESRSAGGRRRRRRREHRPRNPTLAETGGLPPVRGDNPPPPIP